MNIPIYILSAAIVGTGAGLFAGMRYYSREVARAISAALQQHHAGVATSLQSNAAALAANNSALETFSNSIPKGAVILTHARETGGALKFDPTHTVKFQ